jgi:DnaJ-class molecular chaperone
MTKTFKCAFCNGTGIDYYGLLSKESVCLVCNGTGTVEVEEPSVSCVFCSGSGKNPLGARVSCIVCQGKGMVCCPGDSVCPVCNGSGRSVDQLPCTRCKGKGKIQK